MSRRMSFAMTKRQYVDGSKTVTRRIGWRSLKSGEIFTGVEKAQGLRKGERQVVLGDSETLSVRLEQLDAIDQAEVIREGFPDMTPAEFVEMFCRANRCEPDRVITRIEFRRT